MLIWLMANFGLVLTKRIWVEGGVIWFCKQFSEQFCWFRARPRQLNSLKLAKLLSKPANVVSEPTKLLSNAYS